MLVVAKSIGSFFAQVAGNATYGKVHFCQLVRGVGIFLPINTYFFFIAVVAFNKLNRLYKHTTATTGRVINNSLVGFYHFGNQVYNTLGRIKFSLTLALCQCKFAEKVFVHFAYNILLLVFNGINAVYFANECCQFCNV